MQQKVKPNKLYELDFESKVRIKYNESGTIVKLHVIFEELDSSSSSSTNIYTSSSKHVLSDGSDSVSFKVIKGEEDISWKPTSPLVKNLEKNNPGILNEGWINLFIKDDHMNHPRKNTYFKNKQSTSYKAKRSFSLNKSVENIT